MFRAALNSAMPFVAGASALSFFSDEIRLVKCEYGNSFSSKTFDEHFPRGKWNYNWDFREPESLVDKIKYDKATSEEKKTMLDAQKATATRNILLIRHGQYQMDSKGKFLTELGKEQAELLGKRLAATGIKYDKLVMSTMNRATETANIILKSLPEDLPRSSSSLLEEGPPYPPVPAVGHWKPPSSEFFAESARIESAFRKYIHRAKPSQKEDSFELYVCHANVIRYFICRALQFPPEGWLRMSLGNCSLTWIVVRPSGNVSIKAIGDIGHIPTPKVSFT